MQFVLVLGNGNLELEDELYSLMLHNLLFRYKKTKFIYMIWFNFSTELSKEDWKFNKFCTSHYKYYT